MDVRTTSWGFGVTSGLDPGLARELAACCAGLGYGSLWSNDTPEAAGLETLRAFADGAPDLYLGVGVLPLDRHSPARIAAEIERLELDPARLCLGIGSGGLRPPLGAVRSALDELRGLLPDGVRVVVAAMRPRMCGVAGGHADGAFLNWMLPERIRTARAWVHDGAEEAGRQPPPVFSYIRVAVGPGAAERLTAEEQVYREIDDGHRRHFAEMQASPGAVGVAGVDRQAVTDGLRPYAAVLDAPVVRALADADDPRGLFDVARAAAPEGDAALAADTAS